ncbi:MAG: D-sedoheptulose 7-phosphate isomerase [Verrucomicrobiota bacterium]
MNWNRLAEAYLAVAEEVFGPLRRPVDRVAAEIARRLRKGSKVLVCGNGGSAADAQHFAGELVNRFLKDRKPYAAVALSTDTSVMTSIANDYGYDRVFEKQVLALGRRGDVLVAISTSGNAANVCRAVAAARKLGILTVGLTGGKGGRLRRLADRALCVSSSAVTPRIQEGHQVIIHALCEQIEDLLK